MKIFNYNLTFKDKVLIGDHCEYLAINEHKTSFTQQPFSKSKVSKFPVLINLVSGIPFSGLVEKLIMISYEKGTKEGT